MPDKKENKEIQIPVGKYLNGLRKNPWVGVSIVLFVLLVVAAFMMSGKLGLSMVDGEEAGQKLVDFINAQGQGSAEYVSSSVDGSLYQIIVNYNGEEIPVYVTNDGKYLISDVIPLSGEAASDNSDDNSGIDSNAKAEIDESKIEGAPSLGEKNAPVTIVEFTDYECPFCGRHYTETYGQIKKDYIDTGKVKYVMMDFPLNFHPNAQKAAESAECVRDQKGDTAYFAMHDKLFTNQQSLSITNYKKWAREISGVDGAKFDSCLDSGKFEKAVLDEAAYGGSLGISGTPGFFINGIKVEGAYPYDTFKQIIDSELGA